VDHIVQHSPYGVSESQYDELFEQESMLAKIEG